jgi:hypothetical protein
VLESIEDEMSIYQPSKSHPVHFENRNKHHQLEKKDKRLQSIRELQQDMDNISEDNVEDVRDGMEEFNDLEDLGEQENEDNDGCSEDEKIGESKPRKKHKYDMYLNRESDEKRPAGSKIIKNRGLIPYRNKAEKNPRVRQKKRFERSKKSHRGVRPTYSGQQGPYSGEKTGIKTSVTKSTRL